MKLAVLFSGGKDSTLALYKTMQKHEVVCLISIFSKNNESYMFHVPNIEITKLQAESIGLPLVQKTTKGEKEKELKELKEAVKEAKDRYKIEGIVTGAVESVYQSSRIKKICDELNLHCINPLWKMDQIKLLNETLDNGFKTIISGIFAYPFRKEWLGKAIDKKMISQLNELWEKYKFNPAGEGGEIETTVLDTPFFRKKIEVAESEIIDNKDSGVYRIKKAKLIEKS